MRGTLRTLLTTAVTAGAATALLAGGTTAAHADDHARSNHARAAKAAGEDGFGCKDGHVCIIANDGTITDSPWKYGAYNLSDKIGYYWVDNNQTGGAGVVLCYGYYAVNCTGDSVPAGWAYWENLTPINSLKLFP